MCGIFGIITRDNTTAQQQAANAVLKDLFVLSESRGKEASGIARMCNGEVTILKSAQVASLFIASQAFQSIIEKTGSGPVAAMGHSRLVTNGRQSLNANNQPVISGPLVGIHNGIIVNDQEMFEEIGEERVSEVDTEALLAVVNNFRRSGQTFPAAVGAAFGRLEGNASVALIDTESSNICLATNNGSLYYWRDEAGEIFVFGSERFIMEQILEKHFRGRSEAGQIVHLAPNTTLFIRLDDIGCTLSEFGSGGGDGDGDRPEAPSATKPAASQARASTVKIIDLSLPDYPDDVNLKRCTKCILPETFPNISFDTDGVCSYCNAYEPFQTLGIDKLREKLAPYRRTDGKPDCLVGLSGGRDSTYGLHVVKQELGLNPIAYTYDWGMVTDLARRNTARICGKLGVEHILISADIARKRENVRKNIAAWLKRPSLGMIPLFMAGDKQFYYYAHLLRKQTGIPLFIFCAGNDLETTDFKIAFAGLDGSSGRGILTQLSLAKKLSLLKYYASEFLLNPGYLNSSLADTIGAFYSSYLLKDDYLYLYYYVRWEEETVVNTLIDEYDWEISPDTTTTWRIGDGTAAFYNYIYYTVAGFTEHDTFRSNQVREGMLTRDQALRLAREDNKPRWETLEWYASTVGFNLDLALARIHQMPRLY